MGGLRPFKLGGVTVSSFRYDEQQEAYIFYDKQGRVIAKEEGCIDLPRRSYTEVWNRLVEAFGDE